MTANVYYCYDILITADERCITNVSCRITEFNKIKSILFNISLSDEDDKEFLVIMLNQSRFMKVNHGKSAV